MSWEFGQVVCPRCGSTYRDFNAQAWLRDHTAACGTKRKSPTTLSASDREFLRKSAIQAWEDPE